MKNLLSKNFLTKIVWLFPFMTISTSVFAAEGNPNFYSNLTGNFLGIATALVIVTTLIILYRSLSLFVRIREIDIYEKHGLEDYLAEKRANEGSWWKRFNRTVSGAVPIEREKDILFDHEYDGIRELDNNLPPWWLYGFYLTIAIAIFYMGFFQLSANAKSSAELYEIEMADAKEQVDAYLAKQSDRVDETTAEMLTDEASLAEGMDIFKTYCAACHLDHGGGNATSVGPNLTDKYWMHGGSIKDVFATIKNGVPEKGMISWKTQLRPVEIHTVASYILTLQGTNPPDAKEPQGDLYQDENTTTTN